MMQIFVWTLSDVFNLTVIVIALVWAGVFFLSKMRRENTCPHDTGVNETQACDAICRKCRKNLGFIGAWRNKLLDKAKL